MNKKYKGIVMAGGSGTRLHPITKGVSKHLLPVYDKPMIYYPISVLMLAGIREILIISSRQDIPQYERLLGNGSNYGLSIEYAIQENPDGIAQAFLIAENFIKDFNVALVLGDNIFYGHHFSKNLKNAINYDGATIFGFQVKDPQRFGVVEFDDKGSVISIEEKPKIPKSNHAVTGLYFYDNNVVEIAKDLVPSDRGELEITDINNIYKDRSKLRIETLGRGFAWLDTGTHESLLEASQFIEAVEKSQGLKVACLEEIAFANEWITEAEIENHLKGMGNTSYGKYLKKLIDDS